MKRCPECGRDYNDDSMSFCLDDGTELLFGPATAGDEPASAILSEPGSPPVAVTGFPTDEPQTAILHSTAAPGDAPTRAQINTTDQSAILRTEAEAEPQESLGGLSERRSVLAPERASVAGAPQPSAHRAAKPLAALVIAVVILVGGFFGYRYFSASSSKQIEFIAVMPFINESGDADVEYLSDGMTETLISSLSQLSALKVKPRSTVLRFKGKNFDAQSVGRELGVAAVLIGRISQRGQDLALSVELIDAGTDTVIWASRYDRSASALASVQREVARDVVSNLKARLSGADEQRLAKQDTDDAEAYKLYLKGRFFWNKRTARDLQESIGYFEQARDRDPNFALAYSGIADSYAQLSSYGGAMPRDSMQKAKDAVLRAISLDPELAEAHATLGQILHGYDYDFAGAERELRLAIELNPKYPPAHQWLSEVLAAVGRADESIVSIQNALELDPTSPLLNRMYAQNLFYARKWNDSLAQIHKTLEFDPNFSSAHYSLGMILLAQSRFAESSEAFARHKELLGEHEQAEMIRKSYETGGRESFLRTMAENTRLTNSPHYQSAKFYAGLGEYEKALANINRAYDDREFSVSWLRGDPAFDALREDRRFHELVKKVGFP
jgi:TolB-like protein/lipopolysaccharide biosynthesis regulator YciM